MLALRDMHSLLEKIPYSLALIGVIAHRAENGWPEGSSGRTELPHDLALIHVYAEHCVRLVKPHSIAPEPSPPLAYLQILYGACQ